MLSRDARWVAAAVQVVIAWEWLVSGTNKVLSGVFPQGLADTLHEGIQNNPNGWYVAIIERMVLPNSVAVGYFIEAAEVFIGIALFIGAAVLIGPVRRRGAPQYRLAVGEIAAATVASLLCAFLCVNFHFFMGDGVFPWFDPGRAFDEGVTLDTLMPPLSLLILIINVIMLVDMTGMPVARALKPITHRARRLIQGGRPAMAQVSESATPGAS